MTPAPNRITVRTHVNLPAAQAWQRWTTPTDVMQWNAASDDWHTPEAESDLRTGGRFRYRMAARDGSAAFDFEGLFTRVAPGQALEYIMDDGRQVAIAFTDQGSHTEIVQTFDPENVHPADFQQAGWQAIMDNFKRYAEAN